MAEIFSAIARENAEGNVVVLVVTAKRYVLQAIQKFGPAIRIAEISVVFVIGQLRKGWGGFRASRWRRNGGFRRLRRLRSLSRSGDAGEQHE